ncbi:hypothetical protein SBY92_003067 [Candida maltosa Xu316]
MTPIELLYKYERILTAYLQSNSFTANLLITPISKFITESLIIIFIILLSYEIIYWSGIYLKLWTYHAKDVFGEEVPIHCSHIYVRVNIIDKSDGDKLDDYYGLKSEGIRTLYNNWKQINSLGRDIFKMEKFATYYFEFSPEDFEMNEEPEYGSTVEHLRHKVLKLVQESSLLKKFSEPEKLTIENVKIFNNQYKEVGEKENGNYLSKCKIETGNTIDIVIIV